MEISEKVNCLSDIDCVILAGGYGTRLGSPIPKVLSFVDVGRHLLDILLERLKKFGAKRVILALSHQSHLVIKYLEYNKPINMTVIPCQEPQPSGTGGALRYVQSEIRSDLVLVINGDTLVDIDLCDFIVKHKAARGEGSVLCDLEGISTGIYLFSQTALNYISNLPSFSLEEILPKIPTNDIKIDCTFLDIGTPDDLERAPTFIKEMKT